MGTITTVVLKGDYAQGSTAPDRQAMAAREGCVATIDFHFNSDGGQAKGAEIFHKVGDERSKVFAHAMWDAFARIGLSAHGTPVKPADDRSAFIRHYAAPAILIEPLFVSSPAQATWLHDPVEFESLARAIAAVVRSFVDAGVVGLSPGHAYKTSSPNDTGAPCVKGDNERAHNLALVDRVAAVLAEDVPPETRGA